VLSGITDTDKATGREGREGKRKRIPLYIGAGGANAPPAFS
jgi:hypothetical protein